MKWRLLPLATYSAAMNMAIDEAICEAIAKGASPPTIRFYRWKPSAVSIGYFQGLEDEIDLEQCKKLGVEYVRRRTGGGAVYHDPEGEITYSVLAPVSLFPKDITQSYRVICSWLVESLRLVGIESAFHPINDIMVGDKKISGNAQTRRGSVLQQHGTLLYAVDVDRMFSLLKVPDEKMKDKLIRSVKKRVTSVSALQSISLKEVHDALVQGFMKEKKYEEKEITPEELSRAKILASEKYRKNSWNFLR